jgi:hypothetical protein
MRSWLIALFVLISVSLFSQVTPTCDLKVSSASWAFGVNVGIGQKVYNIETHQLFVCTASTASTATLTSASANFRDLGDYNSLENKPTIPAAFTAITRNMGGGGYDSTQITTKGFTQMKLAESGGFTIDTLSYDVVGAACDVTITIWYGTSINSAGTTVNGSTGNRITSLNKTIITSFTNAYIPTGNDVWAQIKTVGTVPRRIHIVLRGHGL